MAISTCCTPARPALVALARRTLPPPSPTRPASASAASASVGLQLLSAWHTSPPAPQHAHQQRRHLAIPTPHRAQHPPAHPLPHPHHHDTAANVHIIASYTGPLHNTFRRLKQFSLGSLALAAGLTPYLLLGPGTIDTMARCVLVLAALGASTASTALISWIGRPYVARLELVRPARPHPHPRPPPPQTHTDPLPPSDTHLVAHTSSWRLQPLQTTIYQPGYLRGSSRPFATWQLAPEPPPATATVIPAEKEGEAGKRKLASLIAETRLASSGDVVGQYWVEWRPSVLSLSPSPSPSSTTPAQAQEGQAQEGQEAQEAQPNSPTWKMQGICTSQGSPLRHFNVHEELLDDQWRVLE